MGEDRGLRPEGFVLSNSPILAGYADLAGHVAALQHDVPHVVTTHSLEPHRPWKAEQLGGGYRVSSWVERTAYNDLLGAFAPDGEDWCYYSFPNGRRVHTTYWRCCKSSGAMALEELPAVAYALEGEAARVQLYGAGEARLAHPVAGTLVGLSLHESVLSRSDARAGTVHVHFPRIGFVLKEVRA